MDPYDRAQTALAAGMQCQWWGRVDIIIKLSTMLIYCTVYGKGLIISNPTHYSIREVVSEHGEQPPSISMSGYCNFTVVIELNRTKVDNMHMIRLTLY